MRSPLSTPRGTLYGALRIQPKKRVLTMGLESEKVQEVIYQPSLEKGLCMHKHFLSLMALMCAFLFVPSVHAQDTKKPNILVIMGDDIGQTNISAYSRGLMGFTTPNIDRIANEGGVFVNYYGQQSCTAGRAAFILGQSPFRTGLTKVGMPGAPVGIQQEDPTIAEFLKPLGYMTGQFGKNHLDRFAHACTRPRLSWRHSHAAERQLPGTGNGTPQ
jgi:hypothetical protein